MIALGWYKNDKHIQKGIYSAIESQGIHVMQHDSTSN